MKPELVSSELRECGFDVLSIFSHGRTVSVDFGWLFPQDRSDPESAPFIAVGSLDFKPTFDGCLKPLQWPAGPNYRIRDMLWEIARSLTKASPLSCLGEVGRRFVLDSYEWTPLAKLSAKEAREARAKFVTENLGLAEHPKQLAESLKAAGLYSPNTSISQICKHLPGIIAKARERQPI